MTFGFRACIRPCHGWGKRPFGACGLYPEDRARALAYLVRARAIETDPAVGSRNVRRARRSTANLHLRDQSWGEIVAQIASEDEEGLIVHTLDFDQVTTARSHPR